MYGPAESDSDTEADADDIDVQDSNVAHGVTVRGRSACPTAASTLLPTSWIIWIQQAAGVKVGGNAWERQVIMQYCSSIVTQ